VANKMEQKNANPIMTAVHASRKNTGCTDSMD
jgi:hypothetical protein